MQRREVPPTDEGWYILHDMRRVDWDAWRGYDQDDRDQLIDSGEELLTEIISEGESGEGDSAFFVGLGHEVDLLGIHLRPTLAELDEIERRLDASELGAITERVDSYVSVTEVSGYLIQDYFDDEAEVDSGIESYIDHRLHPSIPDSSFVSFYPMSKRRQGEDNWYDLPFDERAEHMSSHGEIGKGYAGQVTQIISGSIGFEDWEWGVTLFAKDPTVVKDLLYEMRFDPSTSRFAEFGPFTIGRPMAPADLEALLTGDPIGVESDERPTASTDDSEAHSIRDELDEAGVYAGQPHGEDVHALVLYSTADGEELVDRVDELAGNFDHYDTHVDTGVYEAAERHAIVSLWETASAADTASGFLADLPEVEERAGDEDGWQTMGMFYHVKPEHREDFVETFETVGEKLNEMDGHRETDLFTRVDDECDMFISSRWDAREDAMAFFGDDAFRETVQWGRDILQSRPRHVFLA